MRVYPLIRPLFFRFDAERAHRLSIQLLGLMGSRFTPEPQWSPTLSSAVAGLTFQNPIGLAAGYDKDAEVVDQLFTLGFGFVEVGTLTPRPQDGNPKPRLFRLAEDQAVINRMGFNNCGQQAALERLSEAACKTVRAVNPGILGVNIGANKEGTDRIADYVAGVRMMSPVADYLTVNISSPNTPGLRQLQDEGELNALLSAISEARQKDGPPVFLKVAPDLDDRDPERIVRAAIDHKIDALIVSNTTVARPPLKSNYARETGGLSGAPLKPLALDALRRFRRASGGGIPLIGVGGISSADDAWERIRAGASLVQLYTAMVYEGPGLAPRIARGLAERLKREGFANISELVGTERT